MSRIVKTAKTLRNHWKKSTFAAVAITWGASYTKTYLDTQALMRVYCEKALEYGKQPLNVQTPPRSVTVILNPNANKRNAATEFEDYCAPLLHLAGIAVDVIKTESEGHAKTLMESLDGTTESIVIAGGDGTLSEVVTGLLRRTNENEQLLVPVGVLPLGKNNSFAKSFFPANTKLEKVQALADATMAVVEEVIKPIDVMRIEILEENNDNKKPVYALAGIKWGAFRDAEVKKEKYWYFGGLKKYVTYLLNGFQNSVTWNCEAELSYSPPCTGCSNCYKTQEVKPHSRWFQSYIKENENNLKYQRIHNPHCDQKLEKKISTTDLNVFTSNVIPSSIEEAENIPKLQLSIGPQNLDYLQFVKEGWKSEKGENRTVEESIEARIIEINPGPSKQNDKELWFSIDNEEYEVKPIRVTLLPKLLKMYCKKENNVL